MALKADSYFNAFQRPTINYSLACEENVQSRASAYEIFMSQESHDLTFEDETDMSIMILIFSSIALFCACIVCFLSTLNMD